MIKINVMDSKNTVFIQYDKESDFWKKHVSHVLKNHAYEEINIRPIKSQYGKPSISWEVGYLKNFLGVNILLPEDDSIFKNRVMYLVFSDINQKDFFLKELDSCLTGYLVRAKKEVHIKEIEYSIQKDNIEFCNFTSFTADEQYVFTMNNKTIRTKRPFIDPKNKLSIFESGNIDITINHPQLKDLFKGQEINPDKMHINLDIWASNDYEEYMQHTEGFPMILSNLSVQNIPTRIMPLDKINAEEFHVFSTALEILFEPEVIHTSNNKEAEEFNQLITQGMHNLFLQDNKNFKCIPIKKECYSYII